MVQITLTQNERIQGLERLGYTEREASFLCLAALHGGYFLRRQYCQFLGQSAGGTAAALIEKVLAKGHAKGTTFAGNVHIYHVSARSIYTALGQEDNRNRRLRQPITIKSKLMGLDFVLTHPQCEFLATEQEKVECFTMRLGLDRALLPVNRYRSPAPNPDAPGEVTERYFVEKFPMFLSAPSDQTMPPVVSFCFVDEGEATLSAFWTFLQRYSLLLPRLREFQMVYVAANDIHFEAAEGAFRRFLEQGLRSESPDFSESFVTRLVEHFEARRLYETQNWASFDRAKLIRFRDDRQEFSGEKFEALFRHWKAAGAAAVRTVLNSQTAVSAPVRTTFLTCELKENYDFFGHITTY